MRGRLRGVRNARLFLLCLPLLACVAPRSAIRPEERGPVLFTVTHPDKPGARVSLMGTVHLARTGYRLDRAVERTIDETEQLFVEIDSTPEVERQLQVDALRLGTLPEGQSVKDQLRPETWTRLQKACEQLQLDVAAVSKFKPWLLSLTLTLTAMQRANPDLRSELGLDKRVMSAMRARKKTITSLESPEFQLALLSGGDEAVQDLRLAATLEALEKGETGRKLFDAFEAGDLGTLEQVTLQRGSMRPEHEAFMKKVWTERNLAMFDKVKAAFGSTTPQVVAVGTGHLLGDTGLVRLFEQAGYVVERVKSEGPGAEYVAPWVTESGPDFSIGFPATPMRKVVPLANGAESTLLLWQGGARAYALEVTRAPHLADVVAANGLAIFQSSVDVLAKGRTMKTSETVTFAGRPALHAVIEGGTPSIQLEAYVIAHGDALFSLRAVWSGDAASLPKEEFERFFKTLELK